MKNLVKRFLKKAGWKEPVRDAAGVEQECAEQHTLSRRGMVAALEARPYFGDKIDFYNRYSYAPESLWKLSATPEGGQMVDGAKAERADDGQDAPKLLKVHYGCGPNILPGWVNVDFFEHDHPDYLRVDLLERHPFADNSVAFAFSQDMLEHFTQSESLFFLAEAYRTLQKGGVLRLSFPSLEGVLKRHYTPATETRVNQGEFEAYHFWDHKHFYSRETLKRVAEHLGYTRVDFKGFGQSGHEELCGLDGRPDQQDLNIYVELEK